MRGLFSILSVILVSSCGSYETLNSTIASIDATNQPAEIVQIMTDAVNLWGSHGLDFYFEPDGKIRLHEAPPDWERAWQQGEQGSSDIYLDPDNHGLNPTCSAAHYLGLSVGILERPESGLTGDRYAVALGKVCPWTAMDEQQLLKLLSH